MNSIYVYRASDDAKFVREMNKMSYAFDIYAPFFAVRLIAMICVVQMEKFRYRNDIIISELDISL